VKKASYYILSGIATIVIIFLLCHIQKGIVSQPPTRMEVVLKLDATMEQLQQKYADNIVVEDWDRHYINVVNIQPDRMNSFISGMLRYGGVYEVHMMPGMPSFSWKKYGEGLLDQLKRYSNGDFGIIATGPGKQPKLLTEELGPMIGRSFSYLLPAIATAFVLGLALPILAMLFRRIGSAMDAIHAALTALPDFFVIVLLQLFAIFISKFTTQRLVLITQVANEIPFLIPYVTITLLPCILIYGAMRHAIKREMAQPYVNTALSKGLSRRKALFTHVLRNVMEDLTAIAPRAVTVAVSSMIVAEAICTIFGLGGYLTDRRFNAATTMPAICIFLALFTIVVHLLIALLRKLLVVQTKEVNL